MALFNFGSKKNESVIGIDIGVSSIKVVQLKKRKGVAVLETYGELSLSQYASSEIGQATNLPASKIAEAVRDLLKESNVTTKKAGISIPFSSSLVSLISMPKLQPKQLATMIPIEARKYIPVSINEVSLDYFVVPSNETPTHQDVINTDQKENKDTDKEPTAREKIEVLLVAIHNSTLNKYSEITKLVDLDVSFFEIEIFSTIRSVVEQSIAPVMVIDMGSASTKFYIVEYGIVRVSHVASSGGQNLTQTLSRSLSMDIPKAEELKRKSGIEGNTIENSSEEFTNAKDILSSGLGRIFAEANKVLRQYQQKNNKNIGKVILTGGGATMKGIVNFAKEQLETDVVLSDPFSKVESPAFFEKLLKEVGPEFAVAIGLALRKLQEE
ncbi:MAG: type IV pilus assembly protein PilM [Parcubacteria group bacterium]|nr:type IV pilus assembly protein PilM [Parcubacteria group bacterium]